MLKKFRDFVQEHNDALATSTDILIQEVKIISGINKANKLHSHVGKTIHKAVGDIKNWNPDAKEVSTHKLAHGHTIHHIAHRQERGSSNDDHHFIVSDKSGNVTHHVSGTKSRNHKGSAIHVDSAASSGKSKIKMHDVYHHILKHGHVLTTNSQSHGGIHIWKNLQKKKDVNIHGWDPAKKKAVNVDLHHGTDETHQPDGAVRNLRKHHGDESEVRHAGEIHDMHLVAHIKKKKE